jgi:hypothetical protein
LVKQESRRPYQPVRRGAKDALAGLFPEADGQALFSSAPGQRALAVAAGIVAVAVGAAVLLLRVPGPPWHSFYAEDLGVFFVGALSSPWHLLVPYAGYLELLPRIIGQFAAYAPLREAAAVVTVTGAAVASGCALFVYCASAGHVRSPGWRALLAASVLLLPVAPLEIADNGVNTPWYLLIALFWAVLWRPRTRTGMAAAALVAFLAAASDPLAVVLAPLLAARIYALRRFREHAVTAAWAAGCLLQIPVTRMAAAAHHARLGKLAPPGRSLGFYGHDVVLPALGWHLSWHLQALAGRDGATIIAGCALAAFFGWVLVTQAGRVRMFVATALVTGLVYTLVAATITSWVAAEPVTMRYEPGSRYTTLPIFLIGCAAVVAADARLRRAGPPPGGWLQVAELRGDSLRAVAAAAAIVAVLAAGWVSDFRYLTTRAEQQSWAPVAARWLRECDRPGTPSITVPAWGNTTVTVPCANLRR